MSLKYQIKASEQYIFSRFMASKCYQNIQTKAMAEAARYQHTDSKRIVFLTRGVSDKFLTIPQNNADIYRGFREWKLSRSQ